MYVHDILRHKGRDVFTVDPGATIQELAKALMARKIGAAVVSDHDGAVVGVISERDIIQCVAEHGAECLSCEVRELMTAAVITCGPDTKIDDVMGLMTERRIRHIPVLESGALVGIVSIGDVVKDRIAEVEREASQLRQYISA